MYFQNKREFFHAIAAIVILTAVFGFSAALNLNWNSLAWAFVFATLIIAIHIYAKKLTAHLLDANVEHQLWTMENFGVMPHSKFKSPIQTGVILPIIFTLFTLGKLKFCALLTYEARALKIRAAKRFGFYSYAEMTEFHNALIGSSSTIALLLLSAVAYLSGFETLAKFAVYYSFFNMVPFSDLDGSQIFFGSRVLWTALTLVTLIFTFYALVL